VITPIHIFRYFHYSRICCAILGCVKSTRRVRVVVFEHAGKLFAHGVYGGSACK
jgi:hypothetical protein